MNERLDCPVSREELVFVVEMALLKKRKLWPTRRRPGDHDSLKPIARAIVDHIQLCGIRCFGKVPGQGPSASDLCPELRRNATSLVLNDQEPEG